MAIDYTDNDAGYSWFTSQLDTATYHTRQLSNGMQTPVIDDLDGDGTKEIIVLDGDTFRIFQNISLRETSSYDLTFTSSSENISNFIIYDFFSDGKKEIVLYAQVTDRIYILNYTSSTLHLAQSLTMQGYKGHSMIGCTLYNGTDNCAIVTGGDYDGASTKTSWLT
jgi:hypothetical protein